MILEEKEVYLFIMTWTEFLLQKEKDGMGWLLFWVFEGEEVTLSQGAGV